MTYSPVLKMEVKVDDFHALASFAIPRSFRTHGALALFLVLRPRKGCGVGFYLLSGTGLGLAVHRSGIPLSLARVINIHATRDVSLLDAYLSCSFRST